MIKCNWNRNDTDAIQGDVVMGNESKSYRDDYYFNCPVLLF